MASVSGRARPSSLFLAGTVVLLAVMLAGGLLLGAALSDDAPGVSPADGSVDVGFSRDMGEHHTQAVEMSVRVRDATDDPEIRTLALDILLSQQQQAGQMFGWLAAWRLPQSSAATPMRWMLTGGDHSAMGMPLTRGARMPGMASRADLQRLARERGQEAERRYLQLMIPHHQAGVEMAKYAADRAQEPQVRRLADKIVDSQTSEIRVLKSMLAARGRPLAADR